MRKLMTMIALAACAAAMTGCQTRITWEKNPETAMPVQEVVEVNGVQQLATTRYQMASTTKVMTAAPNTNR